MIKECSFETCELKAEAKGLCKSHWRQQSKGKELTAFRVPIKFCTFPDCGRKHDSRGYCAQHAKQSRLGRELTPLAPRSKRVQRVKKESSPVPPQAVQAPAKPVEVEIPPLRQEQDYTVIPLTEDTIQDPRFKYGLPQHTTHRPTGVAPVRSSLANLGRVPKRKSEGNFRLPVFEPNNDPEAWKELIRYICHKAGTYDTQFLETATLLDARGIINRVVSRYEVP